MLALRSEIRVPGLSERHGGASAVRSLCYRGFIAESRWIGPGYTVVGAQPHIGHGLFFYETRHERLVAEHVGQTYLRVGLPAHIVAEGRVAVQTQPEVQIIAVEEANVVLEIESVAVDVAYRLVGIDGGGTADNLRSVPYPLSRGEALPVVGGEILEAGRSYIADGIAPAVPVFGIEVTRESEHAA